MRRAKPCVGYPLWIRIACCVCPFVFVLAISIAAVCGVQIPWQIFASTNALCGYVVKRIV